jgi:dTDP-4-amino-4,6-dideoxygalactose transaminase
MNETAPQVRGIPVPSRVAMKIPMARPLIDEETRRAVLEVLEPGRLAQGFCAPEFGERFAQRNEAPFATAVSSRTAALLFARMALEVGPRNEVIAMPLTLATIAKAVLFLEEASNETGVHYPILVYRQPLY